MKKKFGFFYDKDKYSIKELITNYVVAFGWLIALLIMVINMIICRDYFSQVINKQIILNKPWIFDRMNRFAFIFFGVFLIGVIFKVIYKRKRKKGLLYSANQTATLKIENFRQLDQQSWLKQQSLILKITYSIFVVIGVVILMLACWVF